MSSLCSSVRIGNVVLGDGSVKIIVPLVGRTETDLCRELAAVEKSQADIIEWRADFFERTTPTEILSAAKAIRMQSLKPILFTLRTAKEGGQRAISDTDYGEFIQCFTASGLASAVDVEVKRGAASSIAFARKANLPVILSYHNFQKTPSVKGLADIFDEMASAGGDVLKVAVMPQTAGDVLRLMTAALDAREKHQKPVIAISMGALGRITRAAASLFGSVATFSSLEKGSAPGQIDVEEMKHLLEIFR